MALAIAAPPPHPAPQGPAVPASVGIVTGRGIEVLQDPAPCLFWPVTVFRHEISHDKIKAMPKTGPKIFPCYLIAVTADDDRGFRLTDTPPLPDVAPGQSVEHTLWAQDPIRLVNFVVAHGWTPTDLLVGDLAVGFHAAKDPGRLFYPGYPGVDSYAIEPVLEIFPPSSIKLRLRNDSATPQRPRAMLALSNLRDGAATSNEASSQAGAA